jgi:pyridoxal phosphate enzyme (YggS family)
VTLASDVATNLATVRARVAAAAERAGRDPARVNIIAVSKTFPASAVLSVVSAGQHDFGENRVQEAAEKVPAVAAQGAQPRWHLIGHLQTNKARAAVELFDIIHSVDSLHLAETLSKHAPAGFPILVEVNVANESTKTGFASADVERAVEAIGALPNLSLLGLMTVAPAVSDPEDVRPVFRELAGLAAKLALPELSMGMSNDFEVAVEEGATMVRIGSAIFGHRG